MMYIKKLMSALAAVILIVVSVSGCGENRPRKKDDQKARYIFLFIGDGMGANHVAAAESYLSYKAGRLGGEQLVFTGFPYYGTATNFSADRHVTCSAASGTAIACGCKTDNGKLGVDKDGKPLTSMAKELKADGYKIGIITTVPINHATPAAFYASVQRRDDYYEVSSQIPESGFEFFSGSGFIELRGRDNDKEASDTYIEEHGYKVCYGIEEFKAAAEDNGNIVFCQESNRKESAGNYESDGNEAEDATLAQMLSLGMEFIGDSSPFFFMCEGGKIDWTAHDNKTMPMIMDVLEMNDAVEVAYNFYLGHKDETLIVVTADHETGGLSLGCGNETVNWEKLETSWTECGGKNTLSYDDNKALNKECSIGWTTHSHTGSPVPVFAIGKGAEKFSGRIDNTDIKSLIL